MNREKLLVVGAGMAAMRAIEELIARAPDAYAITVIGAEPRAAYNRILLSPVLSGEKTFADIVTHDDDWFAANGVTYVSGVSVTDVDRAGRTATLSDGRTLEWDRLLLATGSDPIVIPVPGHDLPGVLAYRDLDDVDAMIAAGACRALVIGGGLLGLEAAAGLAARGATTTVLHLMPWVMERQLDESAGALLKADLEAKGVEVVLKADTAQIEGQGKVERVILKDGRAFEVDIVVMAVGIRPNTALAKAMGLEVERGIVVDDFMTTSDPAVFAVGECVQHRGVCYGLVAPLYESAKTLADRLAGIETGGYLGSALSTRLKVTGVDLFSAGDFTGGEGTEDLVFRDAGRNVYKRLVVKDDVLIGAVMYGECADGGWYFDLIRDGADISDIRDVMIFGRAYADGAPADPKAAVAALPDAAEICGCNGVRKGTIVQAIAEKGLTTLDDVKAHTKASASCGTCAGLATTLLEVYAGVELEVSADPPICTCTIHGHDHVRKEIAARGLKSIPEVMQALEWKTPDGCHVCRPALNYYLLCAWPEDEVDDAQSRFINERAHANIQKDGTYSVVPRMWGGLTTPNELRAIADVADKFKIPTVKVTGGQRIDLLGVKKEDLPAVWADLNAAGLVSGHAYSKGLRTVKTCVGSEWCRFGTQDSTGLGVKLERLLWGSWTPHKVKLGVSGCPRNCAEATIKDVGVVCVDSGYEIHYAGAAGLHVKETVKLCTVATEEEALEYCAALIQIYREDARYLDRIVKWVDRVGHDYVKQRMLDDPDGRKAAYDRFLLSQKQFQKDPWAERAAGAVAKTDFEMIPALPLAVE